MAALFACLAATWYMTGVIAVVHFVHYPLFAKVGEQAFASYHAAHVRLTTWVVALPMIVELAASLWLVVWPVHGAGRPLAGIGLALALATWLITALGAAPAHDRLARGFDPRVLQSLMRADAARALAWLAHSAALMLMAARAWADRVN